MQKFLSETKEPKVYLKEKYFFLVCHIQKRIRIKPKINLYTINGVKPIRSRAFRKKLIVS